MTTQTMIENTDTLNLTIPAGAYSIGRANDNDLLISDKSVSAHHARIYTYMKASYIEDLGSTNGTYINGKRVEKHTVHKGDIIRIGKQQLEIDDII